jgi:hypothetical protein
MGCEHSEVMGSAFQQWQQRHIPDSPAQLSAHEMNQLIRARQQITTRELCIALETMLATLQYCKACSRWVSRMLTQEHNDQ